MKKYFDQIFCFEDFLRYSILCALAMIVTVHPVKAIMFTDNGVVTPKGTLQFEELIGLRYKVDVLEKQVNALRRLGVLTCVAFVIVAGTLLYNNVSQSSETHK